MSTFAEKVIQFNSTLKFSGELPTGIRVMNPFKGNGEILSITKIFYERFYNDNNDRKLILGINPGRFGAGVTGIPFTDTKRLSDICKINIGSIITHEPSSVLIYELIEKYGGVEEFYKDYYINSTCPLGFVKKNNKGNWVNCNYYDYDELFIAMRSFIIDCLKKQTDFGVDTQTCFVLGRKNARYLSVINEQKNLFKTLTVLDHPRYIVQYKSKMKEKYILEYLNKLSSI